MKDHKTRNIVGFFLVLVAIAACAYVALAGVGSTHQGSAKNIKLGLDLAGGVSITYQVNEDDPSSEDMSDTVYKLQQRVAVYSNEAEVYQEGSDRITVEIPGVYDAEEVLANLGNPGKIEFYEMTDLNNLPEDSSDETNSVDSNDAETLDSSQGQTIAPADGETQAPAATKESQETETVKSAAANESESSGESESSSENESSGSNMGMHLVMTGDDIVDAQVLNLSSSYFITKRRFLPFLEPCASFNFAFKGCANWKVKIKRYSLNRCLISSFVPDIHLIDFSPFLCYNLKPK